MSLASGLFVGGPEGKPISSAYLYVSALAFAYSAVCAGSDVAVFFQNGDGTFTEHVIANADAIYEGRLLAADVSGDGRPDLIVVAGPPDTLSAAHVDVYASRTAARSSRP